jgi:catechol 2,3-dioxygenase-like lactoylglutathione lyase family enzyme
MLCGNSLIKLVVLPEGIAAAAPGGIQKAAGYRYWTITIDNIDAVCADCDAKGHKVVVKPSEIRPGVKIAIVADPDGNWVEFLQTA